jgi:biopolymer transport protein ExbB/TolQ
VSTDVHPIIALSSNGIDQVIFHVSSALQVPVLVAALLALAVVIFELGRFAIELVGRRRRDFAALSSGSERARAALLAGDRAGAQTAVAGLARSPAMAATLAFIVAHARTDGGDHECNKALADFDFDCQRRLARTRLLVRAGPALGLMGTLIPLSPALTGLANGNTAQLSHDLRVAFSVTVVGLLIGAIAFGLSLSRDRIYGQDLSDLEYVAAVLSDPGSADDRRAHADGRPTHARPATADPVPTADQRPSQDRSGPASPHPGEEQRPTPERRRIGDPR